MEENQESTWISFSDMMTGLMVIFLFVSVSYMLQVKKQQDERDQIFEEYKENKIRLYNDLYHEFEQDFKKWDVQLDRDLSIKFNNPEVLFQSGQTNIRPYFSDILDEFFPRYLDIILQDKYKGKISEIRVEGHTDNVPAPNYDPDPYIANTLLSQKRSTEVIKHLRNMPYFQQLSADKIEVLEYLLTANGLSYGRTVDDDDNFTIVSDKPVNNEKSRRVEFKIITTSDELLEKVIKNLNQ